MNRQKVLFALALVMLVAGMCPAGIISSVDRSNGRSGNRLPIGVFDGNTDPLLGVVGDGEGVFSDREYAWVNTPMAPIWAGETQDLTGADQVRTFNDDKHRDEVFVTYAVTITEAAYLAMTIDDRIPAEWGDAPSQQAAVDLVVQTWAAPGTFVDTGLDLYIQESATTQRAMSVYATTVKMDPGTYVFGLQPSQKNFYSIIAVPEPATLMLLGLGGLLLRKRR